MRAPFCLIAFMPGLALGTLLSHTAVALAEDVPAAQVPDYYLGAGIRGGQSDSTAFVIDSKIKLFGRGDVTFSTRPALLMGGYDTEWRLPFTVDAGLNARGFALYGGGGLAYNMDDLGETDPMLTGGMDFAVRPRLIASLMLNYIWQDAISDDDTEFMASFNYGF